MKFEYFVNKEKGTVVVKADDAFEEMYREMRFLGSKIGIGSLDFIDEIVFNYKADIDKIRGIARCSDKDDFSIITGSELARLRFLRQHESYRCKIYEEIELELYHRAVMVTNRVKHSLERFIDYEDRISDFLC